MTDNDAENAGLSLATWAPDLVRLSHVADFPHRYPGEKVTFSTRVTIQPPVAGVTLRVAIPEGLAMSDFRAPNALADRPAYVETDKQTEYVVWSLAGLPVGSVQRFEVQANVDPVLWDREVESEATLLTDDGEVLSRQSVSVRVWAKGKYLRNLPELYERDELMGRFLMLFESFWGPINRQINNIACHFDPDLTPVAFLDWLASWVGIELDENLSEETQRRLIRAAVWLYRRRGTKTGLQTVLELYTGGKASITEHRAHDFRLGPNTLLGPGFALGTGNRPHTFSVTIELPPVAPGVRGKRHLAELEKLREQRILAVIRAFKPAHTECNLSLMPLS